LVEQNVRYFPGRLRIGGTGRAEELIERLDYADYRGQRMHSRSQGLADQVPPIAVEASKDTLQVAA